MLDPPGGCSIVDQMTSKSWCSIEQPPGWSSTFYVSFGDIRGLMLPKYPHHIQAGILLPTGEWRRWRQDGVTAVAERVRRFDPIFAGFGHHPEGLHPVLSPRGGDRPGAATGPATACCSSAMPPTP